MAVERESSEATLGGPRLLPALDAASQAFHPLLLTTSQPSVTLHIQGCRQSGFCNSDCMSH